jgi:hypothetical protein
VRLRSFAGLALGAVVGALLAPLAMRTPNAIVPDDGYFYSQIAWHLAERGRSTFDGIHTTSGYHWPWGIVLAFVSRLVALVTASKVAHLHAHLVVSFAILGATAQRFFVTPAARVAAFVMMASTFSLTEMALVAPTLLALLEAERTGKRRDVLAFLLPIVRIDLVCVPLVLAVFRRDRRWVLAGLAILGVLAQLASMKLAFGHAIGVAASLKAPKGLSDVPIVLPMNLFAGPFTLFCYAMHVVLGVAARRHLRLVLASCAFLVAHTLLNMVRDWYWLPSLVGLLYAVEHAAARRLPWVLASAFLVHAVRAEIVYAPDQRIALAFVEALRAQVPIDEAIFTYNHPGYLGFFSDRNVVDGDGLVNDHAYAERLRGGRLAGYLDEEGLCWIVSSEADERPILDLGGLVVEEAEAVVVLRRHVSSQADYALYRRMACRGLPANPITR